MGGGRAVEAALDPVVAGVAEIISHSTLLQPPFGWPYRRVHRMRGELAHPIHP